MSIDEWWNRFAQSFVFVIRLIKVAYISSTINFYLIYTDIWRYSKLKILYEYDSFFKADDFINRSVSMAYCCPTRGHGWASSSSKASSSRRFSWPYAAANWMPMGNPFRLNPIGRDMAGAPAVFCNGVKATLCPRSSQSLPALTVTSTESV